MPSTFLYETVVILNPALDEKGAQDSIDKYRQMAEDAGAKVESIDLWGRRRLEFDIKKNREGIYYILAYTASTEHNPVARLERALHIDESVLRSMTIKRDDLKKRPKRKARRAQARAKAKRAAAEAAAAAHAASQPAPSAPMADAEAAGASA